MPDAGIQPYTSDQLRCFVAVKHSLSTHKLSKADIIFAADYITQRFGRSLKGKPLLTPEQLVVFLTLSYRKHLCLYALTFNRELDDAIIKRNTELLDYLLTQDVEAFVEIYDNDLLSEKDKAYLTGLLTHELQGTAEMWKSNEGITHEHHAQCLDRACHSHANIVETDPVQRELRANERVPDIICFQDKVQGKKCLPLLETIQLLLTDRLDRMNSEFKDLIRTRYRKEVAMYERYLMSYQ